MITKARKSLIHKGFRAYHQYGIPFISCYILTERSQQQCQMNVLKDLQVLKMFALPTYFLIINISILHWSYAYFNTPAYISENKLTQYFIEKYGITDKETEVIELILGGLTYKQIADRLFISPKTVDNHVQNIYRKLQVTSKIQLSNLIRSKEK
ncbi:protein of unknown function [Ruminococcaceae bacterium BL-4]|nr:protein of unknown function [Ruminococcaceae bacterium BL-4]